MLTGLHIFGFIIDLDYAPSVMVGGSEHWDDLKKIFSRDHQLMMTEYKGVLTYVS